jgi:large subunit ribosomal protein L23
MGILGKKKTADKKVAAKKAPAKKTDEKAVAAKSDKGTAPKRSVEQKSAFAFNVIESPVFTEKSDRGQAQGVYTFFVHRSASKVLVADAMKALYGVTPVSVRVINMRGKKVRFGRNEGVRKARKKAIVTLKSGDSIAVME